MDTQSAGLTCLEMFAMPENRGMHAKVAIVSKQGEDSRARLGLPYLDHSGIWLLSVLSQENCKKVKCLYSTFMHPALL